MRGVFDEEEQRPAQQRQDRELTLGSGTLLAIFFGLVLICGVCFGLGYAVGRRGGQDPAGLQAAGATPVSAETEGSKPKPSAVTASPLQAASTDATDAAAVAEANGALGAQTAVGAVNPTAGQAPAQSGVAGNQKQSSQAAVVTTAIKPAGSLMVQIAAVTDAEDANVLMGALRKRGYVVTGQRDAGDGLIHVRIGPFSSRDEADKWRMKLLNDGYNAILQP
jgi:cell division septation protein DedD